MSRIQRRVILLAACLAVAPARAARAVVGAIGVSGATNQQRDEAVAKAGAAALQ